MAAGAWAIVIRPTSGFCCFVLACAIITIAEAADMFFKYGKLIFL